MLIITDALKARHLLERFKPKHLNILAVLESEEHGTRTVQTHNIVTTAGNVWYAQQAASEAPTNTFNHNYLLSSGPGTPAAADDWDDYSASVIAGANVTIDAGYPKTNDADADNTGAGAAVVTWRFSYTKASFSGTVTHGVITIASPIAGSPLLTSFAFASSFSKTTDDTLKVFVNHQLTGV